MIDRSAKEEYLLELENLLSKRDEIRQKQLSAYNLGTATRARTTTLNAAADRLNERIEFLRQEIKKCA